MTASSASPRRWARPAAAALIAVAIVAALGYGYASPYVALDRMKAAADARDAATLNDYVDYPALRASLKQQVGELLAKRIEARHSSNPLLLLGAVIGAALIGPLVEAYATPDGVAALLNGMPPTGKPGEQPPPAGSGAAPAPSEAGQTTTPGTPPAPADTTAASGGAAPEARPQTSAGYRSLNEFVVTWQRGASGAPDGEYYAAVLQRHGLFSWKLAAVELNGEPPRAQP